MITFALGLLIILKQSGILFAPPDQGPSIELLAIGALCCNVPGILQVIQWRSGTSSSPGPQPQSPSASLSASSPEGE
jgi:hypothetical protein